MSATLQGVQFRCDWCGTYSEERPLAASGIIVETPLPDGWIGVGYGSIRREPAVFINLCPACSARPVGDLLTHLGQLSDPAQATT